MLVPDDKIKGPRTRSLTQMPPPFFPPGPYCEPWCEPFVNPFSPRPRPPPPPAGSRPSETVSATPPTAVPSSSYGSYHFATMAHSGLNPGDQLITGVFAVPPADALSPPTLLVAFNTGCIPQVCATSFVARAVITCSSPGSPKMAAYNLFSSTASCSQNPGYLSMPLPTGVTADNIVSALVTVDAC